MSFNVIAEKKCSNILCHLGQHTHVHVHVHTLTLTSGKSVVSQRQLKDRHKHVFSTYKMHYDRKLFDTNSGLHLTTNIINTIKTKQKVN